LRIKAKVEGELNLTGQGFYWDHRPGDEREVSEELGKKILTNKNYVKVGASSKTAPKKPKDEKPEDKPVERLDEKKPEKKIGGGKE